MRVFIQIFFPSNNHRAEGKKAREDENKREKEDELTFIIINLLWSKGAHN